MSLHGALGATVIEYRLPESAARVNHRATAPLHLRGLFHGCF